MTALYADILPPLFARSAMGMRPGLGVTRALLQALGHPDQQMGHVSVAGTNGKGSTSYLLSRALRAAGHRVGLFTSPHLCSYTERIRVNGEPIPQHAVVTLLQQLQAAEATTNLTASFFEATTLIACLYFAAQKVDVAVMECGLGGRLDATNALDDGLRRATIITPISLDHQHILGPDHVTIAREKAAIMRAGVPCVVAPQRGDVAAVLQAHGALVQAPMVWVDDTAERSAAHGRPRLPGYLDDNRRVAEAACAVLSAQGLSSTSHHLDEAVHTFAWPGRYHKLPPMRAGGAATLIDGSHNPAGMAALCATLQADPELCGKRLHALFAVAPHKDAAELERIVRPHVVALHRCQLALYPEAGLPTAADKLRALHEGLGADDVLLVVGSLYLAGEALAHLCGWPIDPPVRG